MKKYFYPLTLVAFTITIATSYFLNKNNDKSVLPDFKERTGAVALSAEWMNTKSAIQLLLAEIRRNPTNNQAKINLAQAYIQEARITGNYSYYNKAALDLLKPVLKKLPSNYEALCCKATILLSQHHFNEALQVAEAAQKSNPSNSFSYGLLCDAYVELGQYQKAVEMADKMVSIRPDIRSYSRISYLREIHGDLPGAIEAMNLAVSAGFPGLEQTCWARVTLAHLYEESGNIDKAEEQYQIALYERPGYAYALAGLSKVEQANGNFGNAILHLEKAINQIEDPAFYAQQTELYNKTGNLFKARKSAETTIKLLSAGEESESDEGHGHYADMELAYTYLDLYNYNKALDHAQLEYERRPENIEATEALAWVRYKRGEYDKANELITKATRLKTSNQTLAARAALIKVKAGEKSIGMQMMSSLNVYHPSISNNLKSELKKLIDLK